MITADGQEVIIVITSENEVPQEAKPILVTPISPAASVESSAPSVEDDPDSDWHPDSPLDHRNKKRRSSRQQKRTAGEKSKVSKQTYKSVKDKRERKKLQNVVAARRYRDKKKSEQQCLEEEEAKLAAKNAKLEATVRETENEVNTLKKLMVELGLVKVSTSQA